MFFFSKKSHSFKKNIQQTKHHWQEIPRGELHLCTEAKRPENKVKNRYTTIFPCMYITLIHTKNTIHPNFRIIL